MQNTYFEQVHLHYEDTKYNFKKHHLMHKLRKTDWQYVHYIFYFQKKSIDFKVSFCNIYIVQYIKIANVWNENLGSQQSRFPWIFLTIFVRRFLPGLNDATISLICWTLQIQENIKYHCYSL